MMKAMLIAWVVIAVAIALVAGLMDSVEIEGGVLATLWVAALFGLVNAIIGPILRFLSIPLTLITLGLFALVVNGALLAITAGITDYLSVGSFWTTIGAAFLISLFSAVLGFLVMPKVTDSTPA